MKIPNVTVMLWIAPIVIQSIIAIVMLHRKLVEVFPVFFTYSVLLPTREIVLLFVRNYLGVYSRAYWFAYWIGEAIVVALSLGVIYEVIWHLIRPHLFLRRFAFVFFWIVAAVAAGLGLIMFLSSSRSGQPDPLFESIILVERSVRLLQAFWLIVLSLLMSRLGLTWQYYAVGIATGFGVYSASDLALLELRAHLHLITDGTLVLLNSIAYNVAVTIWVLYFVPSRPRKVVVESLPSTDIARWNDVLSEYLNK
jgi:hypothetical protein